MSMMSMMSIMSLISIMSMTRMMSIMSMTRMMSLISIMSMTRMMSIMSTGSWVELAIKKHEIKMNLRGLQTSNNLFQNCLNQLSPETSSDSSSCRGYLVDGTDLGTAGNLSVQALVRDVSSCGS